VINVFKYIYLLVIDIIVGFFRIINAWRKKSKVLVYTDSRGFEISRVYNKKNPFSSYIKYFIFNYSCTTVICPYKFTSILDFMEYLESYSSNFDYIILHCGIVDFAPRPESSFDSMLNSKLKIISKNNWGGYFEKTERLPGPNYEGEVTYSFFTQDFLRDVVMPRLKKLDGLIYISINPVLSDWNGKYWRKRPININEQLFFDDILKNGLDSYVDLSKLSDKDVMELTADNVHYNKSGFDFILDALIMKLK
jgi:hypothetical protein